MCIKNIPSFCNNLHHQNRAQNVDEARQSKSPVKTETSNFKTDVF